MPGIELLRHAMTWGNLERRWTGTTDEPLAPEGIALARRCARPAEAVPRRVWSSPLRRCLETAAILFPGAQVITLPALRESAMGLLENKNHRELAGEPFYREWLRSGGQTPVPGMESREEVAARAVPVFRAILDELAAAGEDGAVVTHGGVIMAVCAALGTPRQDDYRWWAPCCGGWRIDLEGWRETGCFTVTSGILPEKEETP